MSNSHEHQPDTKIELIEYLAKVTKPRVSCCAAKIINYVQAVQEWQDSQTIDQDDYDNEYFSKTTTMAGSVELIPKSAKV
jgi:uncharacterized protein YlzI (FlbEa/FlbD family)